MQLRRECSLCTMAPLSPTRVGIAVLVGVLLERTQAFIPTVPITTTGARRGCVPSKTVESGRNGLLFSAAAPVAEYAAPKTPPEFEQSPWVLLEGMPYTAGKSDVVSFFEGLEVDSVHVPMAAEDSPRAGSCKGVSVVKLKSVDEAVKAMQRHGREIMGRWITVERCMNPSESTTVKLKGLSYSATIEDLEALFEPCGEVEGVTISSDRGEVAYVNFASPEGAANAVKLDGTEFAGRWLDITLYVKYFRPVRRARKNRVRISGLPFEADTSDVQAMLDTLGVAVTDLYVPPFRANPTRNMGVAYATLPSEEELQALLAQGGSTMGNRTVRFTDPAERPVGNGVGNGSLPPRGSPRGMRQGDANGEGRPRRDGASTESTAWENRVYLGNLPFEMTGEDIVNFLERNDVGEIAKVALPKGKGGTAYLAFNTPEMAQRAVELNGAMVEKDGRSRLLRANHMANASAGGPPQQ